MKKTHLILFLIWCATSLTAQTDSTKKAFSFSGYGEVYYSYDFANPADRDKPSFIYNHKRHNEVNVNLVYAKANYYKNNLRANLAIMFGNYAHYNLASEPIWAQFIYEANIGAKISKKHNLWIDAGILPSHIGFESAVSADCPTLTRSILAENSPYYETGVKLSYITPNDKLYAAALILNGWQRIKIPQGFNRPAYGIQLTFTPSSKLKFNYSNFLGSYLPDSMKNFRLFHNLYAIYQPLSYLQITAGFDLGTDFFPTKNYSWYSPVLIIRGTIKKRFALAYRIEYYADKHETMITTNIGKGFNVLGNSLNFDCQINKYLLWRIEGKAYYATTPIFSLAKKESNFNYSITTALSVKFD